MLEYLVFRFLSLLAPRIPLRLAYRLCDPIGDLAWLLLRARRRTVRANLAAILGADAGDLDRRVRQVFREGARYYYDTFLAPALSDRDLERLVSVEGWENLERALQQGKGAVVVTAHLGSPSLVAQILGVRKRKIVVVVEPIRPPGLFDLMSRARATRGEIRLLPLGPDTTRELSDALRRNEIVGLVADRDVAGNGVPVRFFGRETPMPAGPVMLSIRSGAPLIPAFTYRVGDGHFLARVDPPLEMERTGSLREDLHRNTQRMVSVLEAAIRRSPEQWVVFEPIWSERATGCSSGEVR